MVQCSFQLPRPFSHAAHGIQAASDGALRPTSAAADNEAPCCFLALMQGQDFPVGPTQPDPCGRQFDRSQPPFELDGLLDPPSAAAIHAADVSATVADDGGVIVMAVDSAASLDERERMTCQVGSFLAFADADHLTSTWR